MDTTWTKHCEARCTGLKSNPKSVPAERLDTWFELLSDRRFRRLITILEGRSDGVTETNEFFDHFCRRSVDHEAETTDDSRIRLQIDFHHRLLPKLTSTGVIADADETDGIRYVPSDDFKALVASVSKSSFPAKADRSAAAEAECTREDVVLACLANYRRRIVLTRLRMHKRISLADLADEVTEYEQGQPLCDINEEQVLKVYLSLYHDHLPHLMDAGLINYDQQTDWISLSDQSTDLDCYRPFLPND